MIARARDVKPGTIVRWRGWWGVLEPGRALHRWQAPAVILEPDDELVIEPDIASSWQKPHRRRRANLPG